jgi:hypothetical protein
MKRLIIFIFVGITFAQEYEDVVYLKDGSIIRGMIIEQVPNEYIKIKSGKNVFVYQMDEIEVIKKENGKNMEKWYTYWSVGTSTPIFSDEYITRMKDAIDPFTETKLSIDMFGYYRHLNEKAILGFIINCSVHRIEGSFRINGFVYPNTIYTYNEQVNYYLYGLSYINYSKIFGSGFYYRGDIGLTMGGLISNIGDISETKSYDGGLGILLGGGYSWDLGGTRILLGTYYSTKSIDGDSQNNLSISLGGLF